MTPHSIAKALGVNTAAADMESEDGRPDMPGVGPVGRVEPDPAPELAPEPVPVPAPGALVVPFLAGGATMVPSGGGHTPRMAAMSWGWVMG